MEKYREIYATLRNRIRKGEFADGKLLPSDHKLMMDFSASRETVRKAMKQLANEGYVQRLRGKGTVAIDRKQFHFPVSEIVSYTELVKSEGLDSCNHVESLTRTSLPDVFEATNPAPMHRLVRLRIVEGEADIVDYDYVDTTVVPELSAAEAEHSLFHYFEQILHLEIDYAIKQLTVEQATLDDQRLLGVPAQTPIVVVRSRTYLRDTRIISFTESRHRADRFSSVEFARRHHTN